MNSGIIFDIKKYAIHDGPGIRTTVFLKGCPLRCPWCHNPEGQISKPELIFQENRCIKDCSLCINNCPQKAIFMGSKKIFIDRERCDLCGECTEACPTEALKIIGRTVTVEEVMNEIEKDIIFYEESGGGVTFSGGEPLIQPEFLNSLLEECKARDIHTAVDTCGYSSTDVFDKIQDKVNLFLYDIKTTDKKKHEEATGISNDLILENLKKLSDKENKIIIRIPIVPGFNDTIENMTQIGLFLEPLKGIKEINLLPYHKTGSQKYKNLERLDTMNKIQAPSNKNTEKLKKKLEDFGFKVKKGG